VTSGFARGRRRRGRPHSLNVAAAPRRTTAVTAKNAMFNRCLLLSRSPGRHALMLFSEPTDSPAQTPGYGPGTGGAGRQPAPAT
jgi:hypothetical protein